MEENLISSFSFRLPNTLHGWQTFNFKMASFVPITLPAVLAARATAENDKILQYFSVLQELFGNCADMLGEPQLVSVNYKGDNQVVFKRVTFKASILEIHPRSITGSSSYFCHKANLNSLFRQNSNVTYF